MHIHKLPIEILNHLLYDYLDMNSILKFCSTAKHYHKYNILFDNQLEIIKQAQKGWNYCLEKGHLIPITKFINEGYIKYTVNMVHTKEEWDNIIDNVIKSYNTLQYFDTDIQKRYIMKRYQNEKFNMVNDGKKIIDLKLNNVPINLEFNKFLFYHNQRHHEFALKLYDNDHSINLICNFELSYYIACRHGHLNLVKLFQNYSQDINYELAMIYACFSSNKDLMEYLYQKAIESHSHIDLSKLFYYSVSLASLTLFEVMQYSVIPILNVIGKDCPKKINNIETVKWIVKKYSEINHIAISGAITHFINPNNVLHYDSSYIVGLMSECEENTELYKWICSLNPNMVHTAIDAFVWDL